MVKEQTLCHLINGNKILLKMAVRGVSIGKWNAPGGNVEGGESPEECAVREVFEETGLRAKNLFKHGIINFYLNGSQEITIEGHLFSTHDFDGILKSSEEGEVRWFDTTELPLDKMWPDDAYWLNLMLAGKRFDAEFHFDETNTRIVKHAIKLL